MLQSTRQPTRRNPTSSPGTDPWYDVEGAATFFGTTPRYVRELVQRRELRHCLIGRRLRFRQSDLEALIVRCTREEMG